MSKKRKRKSNKKIFFGLLLVLILIVFGLYIYRNYQNSPKPPAFTGSGSIDNPLYTGEKTDSLQVIALEMVSKYGDAIIIKYGDFEILIDGGQTSDAQNVQKALNEYVSDDILDMLIVTHPHADHTGGLSKTTTFSGINDINFIIDYGYTNQTVTNTNYEKIRDSYINQDTVYYPIYDLFNKEDVLSKYYITSEIYIEFLDSGLYVPKGEKLPSGGDVNETSIACLLSYGKTKYFFGGDIDQIAEKAITDNYPNLVSKEDFVVYKASHHGSKTSNIDSILKLLMPDIIYISSAITTANQENKPYSPQHPYKECVARMKKYTESIYWNGINGTLLFTSKQDGSTSFLGLGRTINYYIEGKIVSSMLEKDITLFESKWYLNYLI